VNALRAAFATTPLTTISTKFELCRLWHNVRAQLGAFKGTKTAALPTLGIEGRFSAALQMWRREVTKVGT